MDDGTLLPRAILRQDRPAYDQVAARLADAGRGTPVRIIAFAFHLGARRHFGTRRDPLEVVRFVAEARAMLAEGRDLPAWEAEALVYATLDMDLAGVAEVVDGLSPGCIAEIEGQLLFKISPTPSGPRI